MAPSVLERCAVVSEPTGSSSRTYDNCTRLLHRPSLGRWDLAPSRNWWNIWRVGGCIYLASTTSTASTVSTASTASTALAVSTASTAMVVARIETFLRNVRVCFTSGCTRVSHCSVQILPHMAYSNADVKNRLNFLHRKRRSRPYLCTLELPTSWLWLVIGQLLISPR